MTLRPSSVRGLIVSGTDTGVGKTVLAGCIARVLRGQGRRPAVFKPVASGCQPLREGLVSEDAMFLAWCAGTPHAIADVCPQRYREALAPAVAAEVEGRAVDWAAVDRSFAWMCRDADCAVVEGVGGLLVPMDERHTFADVASSLGLPVVVVARAALGTINHTLLTLEALRSRGIEVAGVVINRYPQDQPTLAEESAARSIERWGRTRVLTVVPDAKMEMGDEDRAPRIPGSVLDAVAQVDWWALMGGGRRAPQAPDGQEEGSNRDR